MMLCGLSLDKGIHFVYRNTKIYSTQETHFHKCWRGLGDHTFYLLTVVNVLAKQLSSIYKLILVIHKKSYKCVCVY